MYKIAAIDVDGVLADFEDAFCRKFGYHNRQIVDLEKRYPGRADDIDLFVKASRTYEYLNILPLGVEIVRFLNREGFNIHIVSSRPEYCTQITGLWLKQNKIPFHYLSVGVVNKVGAYMNLQPALVVEDILYIASSLAGLGIHSFLMDHPWNQSKANFNGFRRISSFEQFLTKYKQVSETLIEI